MNDIQCSADRPQFHFLSSNQKFEFHFMKETILLIFMCEEWRVCVGVRAR